MKIIGVAVFTLISVMAMGAHAQDLTYRVEPGGAVNGTDSYGNSYTGNVAPGGAMEMQDQRGNTYSGAVDPYGNANLSR